MNDLPRFEESASPSPQIVPHSREAEEAVIGAVLINPEAYYDTAQFLRSDDFYIHRHRWIWEAFTRLHERRTPLDLLTVAEELDQMGPLGEVGGPAYLTSLVSNVPSSLHAEAYGRIVEQTAVRRKMLAAANQIAKLAYQEEMGIEAVMDEAEKAVFGVSERRLTRDLHMLFPGVPTAVTVAAALAGALVAALRAPLFAAVFTLAVVQAETAPVVAIAVLVGALLNVVLAMRSARRGDGQGGSASDRQDGGAQ